jgi:MtN3 and saliva related transmembrane protein
MTSRGAEFSGGALAGSAVKPIEVSPMDHVTLIGLLAGTLTTIAFIPQLQQTWRTRSAQDVSLGMLLTFTIGVFLWLIYGLLLGALPIILANLITLVLTLAILILKVRYRP